MEPKSSLVIKLCKIMSEIGEVSKTGRNNYQNYNYIEEAKVASILRPLLSKYNIFIFPSVTEILQKQIPTAKGQTNQTLLNMKYTFVDGDSGEREEINWAGEAHDTGDKSLWKAYTGAQKYLFLKAFNLGSDQDPEKEETQAKPRGPAKTAPASTPKVGSPPTSKISAEVGAAPLFDDLGEVVTATGMKVKDVWDKHRAKAIQKSLEIRQRMETNDVLEYWERALIDYGVENSFLLDA